MLSDCLILPLIPFQRPIPSATHICDYDDSLCLATILARCDVGCATMQHRTISDSGGVEGEAQNNAESGNTVCKGCLP